MEMEKFVNAQMSEEELDFVAGGAGYSYIIKRNDGKYDVVTANKKLSVAQVRTLLKGGPIDHKLNDVESSILRDVPGSKMDVVKKRLNKAYGGCTFQVIKV